MLPGDKTQGFEGAEGLEGPAEVSHPLLHAFLSRPQIENEEQEARVARVGRQQVSPTNALSGRLRQKGEALRVGVYPDIPAPS